MATSRTAPAAVAAPTCRRCHGRGWHYLEGGADQWPLEVACDACANDDPDAGDGDGDDDDCRWGDDVAEGCPDDSSRFALVARHDHAA